MKQLLFLLLFPALALAQYPGNAGQKITLGEQTTADGLVWRGITSDTSNLLTNKLDTSVYIVLDTGTRAMWYYRASTTPKWTRLVDSLNNLQGTLSVAKGGTGSATQNFVDLTTTQSIGGAKTFTSAVTATRFNPTSSTATGTGMFAPTSTSLGFSTNGTNRVTINSSGDIGVGTTPLTGGGAAKWITLEGTAYGGGLISSVNGIIKAYYYYENGFGLFQGAVGVGVQFLSANLVALTVDTLQRVGIGIVQPTEKLHIIGNARITGNIAAGVTSATARLHLAAGTATASTAPLKFTSGTNLTTAEAGAMEFNGTNLFFSPSTTRHTVNHGLTGSATLDFPSTTTLLSADLTITVTGAADGDVVSLGVPNAAVNANTCYTAWVSSANTVTIRFNNYSSGTVNPASGTFKVFVTK